MSALAADILDRDRDQRLLQNQVDQGFTQRRPRKAHSAVVFRLRHEPFLPVSLRTVHFWYRFIVSASCRKVNTVSSAVCKETVNIFSCCKRKHLIRAEDTVQVGTSLLHSVIHRPVYNRRIPLLKILHGFPNIQQAVASLVGIACVQHEHGAYSAPETVTCPVSPLLVSVSVTATVRVWCTGQTGWRSGCRDSSTDSLCGRPAASAAPSARHMRVPPSTSVAPCANR